MVSCYEAGREGFWLHRFLQAQGIINAVVAYGQNIETHHFSDTYGPNLRSCRT
jgi:hypothetical protein